MEQERRSTGGQRVPFEALVVVASQKGGAGAYECEAVDLSEKGMHLRTAYLPDAGQTLTFRFETGSGEVSLDGEVVWREEQARGGEFGVRFLSADEAALATLREALGLVPGPEEEEPAPDRVVRGSRVRLHIDGLGSPMRARVRDDHTGEVLVGSNLDFLKVGKPLELEDVDRGKRRSAFVDKVEVEVDPASKVPQLVVTLRYEEGGKAADVAKSAAGVKATADSKGSRADEAPRTKATADSGAEKAEKSAEKAQADAEGEAGDAPEGEAPAPRFKDTIAQVGSRLALFGASAKAAVGSLVERARARREEPEEEGTPRRVTAPPPDGGVQISSLRPQRSATEETVENNEELNGIEETDEESLKIRKKQRTLVAAGAGLLAVLLVVFGVRAKSAPPPGADAASAETTAATAATVVAAFPGAGAAAAAVSGDVISANVPLFGTTPLSTTEPAPLPPTAAPAGTLAAAGAAAAAPHAGGDDDDDKGDEPSGPGKTEYGKGEVKKPRIIRIKMDAPITDLRGSTSGDTLTLFLPGRRNVEPAATLAKRDKRLSAVKAVPKDGGLEVSLAFKDNMPPFLAKANGKMLEVDLGETPKDDGDDSGKTAAKKGGKKKVAKGSKAADKKKATAKKGDKKGSKKGKKKNNDD